MRTARARLVMELAALVLILAACAEGREDWTPVLEETSTVFLQSNTNRALSSVQMARDQLEQHPAAAEAALEEAEATLVHISSYYLPLMRARESAYNAYRYFYLGERSSMGRQLDDIESELLHVADDAPPTVRSVVAEVLEKVADTRVAEAGSQEETRQALELLARRLDLAVLKGELILR